jgi:nicotinamidase-related amidase
MRALLVVDMQNDFCREEGALFLERSRNIVNSVVKAVKEAREMGDAVIYTQDWHIKNDSEFKLWPEHCIEGSWGAEVIDELPEPDYYIKKRRYSAFLMTDLLLILKELEIKRITVVGVATDVCVMHTAVDAVQYGYKVSVLKNCTAGTSEEREKFALKHMEILGCNVV